MATKYKPRIITYCLWCGNKLQVLESRFRRGNGQYCNRSCKMSHYHACKGHGTYILHCPICGTKRKVRKSHKGSVFTCGKEKCTTKYRWNKFLAAFEEDYGTPLDQTLYTLYIEYQMSYRDISAITNLNGRTIKKALIAFDIPIRKRDEAVKTQWTNGKHDNQTGRNHYRWQGGNSINYGISRTEWCALAEAIRHRDNHLCTRCRITEQESIRRHNKTLDVHHIVPYNLSHDNSPGNLRTLCPSCHQIVERQFIWLL